MGTRFFRFSPIVCDSKKFCAHAVPFFTVFLCYHIINENRGNIFNKVIFGCFKVRDFFAGT
jgi:hypothetical protein